ncbi:hypothetical protein BDL97_01G166800 [Sphagnum fallax]|nr:hypothetical protein BDL97_01G166800 [Sphagnum fallax]
MGFVYSKRRNMVELAVRRVSTAVSRPVAGLAKIEGAAAGKLRAADMGWPGMMSIRLHELDGMYDHPSLPMAGDALQLLELQCHSKLAGRRIQRPKKGTTKADAVEDNVESTPAPSLESPLLWLRADPELEYLAELNLLQPEQMWIYQLEKDRDVVGQSQAIAALRAHSRTSFAIVNALNNCLTDTKVFCRVRMEAAAALASTATEATSWAGLQHLIKYYKSCRFDPDIGLPRSNDFHDFAEYFVLEAIPTAVADVRGSDGTSPPEAVDFILTILKHNDNSGNAYSDVFWLASVIESVSSLEFGQQNLQTLLRILKQIDRFLQYDRLMPSYNGVVSISCIHTLKKLALRLSQVLPSERIKRLLQPFTGGPTTTRWQVRVAAMKALVDLEVQAQGLQAAVILAVHFMEADPSLRVQSKVMKHLLHVASNKKNGTLDIGGSATAELLSLLRSSTAFHNVLLRHHLFSFLQVLAGRSAAIYRLVDNKSKATPGQATLEKKSVGNVTSKPGSFKVRLRPTETPLAAPRVEPIKLRLPGRPNLPRDNPDHAESGSSGGKQDVEEQKVGKLKLKIKTSSSSAQEGAGDDMGQAVEVSTGAVTKGPVNVNSPVSLGEVVKQEVEDPSFILQDGTSYEKGMQVKEAQKLEPRYENRMSGGDVTGEDENPQLFEYDNAAVTDSSPRAVGQDRQLSGGRYLLMNVETNGGDSVDHDIEHKSSLSQGSDEGVEIAGADLHQYTSLLEGAAGVLSTHDGGGDDTPSQKQEGERSDKKEKKSEKKEKKDRKERKEKKNKKHDKHNDPEYQEKKRKRREEKDQRHHEGHKSMKVEVKPVDGVVASESAKPDGDTKLRLKIKKPRTNL